MNREQILARIAVINARQAELDNTIKTATDVKANEAARSEEDKLIEERGSLNGQLLEMTAAAPKPLWPPPSRPRPRSSMPIRKADRIRAAPCRSGRL